MRNLVDELEIEAAHADHMAQMAMYWMKQAQEAQQTLAAVVYASGQQIAVHSGHLRDLPRVELLREEYPYDMTTRFRARLRPESDSGSHPEGEDREAG